MSAQYFYPDQLESSRLITRKLVAVDTAAWAHFFADKEAVALFPDFGLTTHEARASHWIEKTLARYADNRYGLQALIEKSSNNFVGQCGLLAQEVDGIYELEVGYHIFKKYWGQGFAPEAAKIFIDFAFKYNLSDSIISIIDIRNVNSQRVAEKNGLTRGKQTRWMDLNVYIYRMAKSDWK